MAILSEHGSSGYGNQMLTVGLTGGMGSGKSVVCDMLEARGYEAVALTGKAEQASYLESIGAARVLVRGEVDFGARPMEKAEWAGGIDNLGGEALTWLTRTVDYGGNIASIGLAASHELNTTVLPFILRAVCLLGINSVETPRDLRLAVWRRLGSDLKPRHLDKIASNTVKFAELPGAFQAFIDGEVVGRTLVEIG